MEGKYFLDGLVGGWNIIKMWW